MSLVIPGSSRSAPMACLGCVTHIGTLDPSDKGVRGESYEGKGLSFSIHPESWESIARIGGGSWWETDLAGRKILDGYRALDGNADKFAAWGVREGLLTPCISFVVSWEDEEWGQRMEIELPSREQALEEVEHLEDGEYEIFNRPGWAPTRELLRAMGHNMDRAGRPSPDALEAALTIWAERNDLDGVCGKTPTTPIALVPQGGLYSRTRFPGFPSPRSKAPLSAPAVRGSARHCRAPSPVARWWDDCIHPCSGSRRPHASPLRHLGLGVPLFGWKSAGVLPGCAP